MKGKLSPSEARKYLSILECNDRSDFQELKKKWRELCKRFHPDKHSSSAREAYLAELKECRKKGIPFLGEHVLSQEEAEGKFKEIMDAYYMLTDPSYAYKKDLNNSSDDLDIIIPISLSFYEGFFGRNLQLNLCSYELDDKGEYVEPSNDSLTKPEKITINIPAGSSGKMKRDFQNKGHRRGELRGRVVILIDIQQDPRYSYDPSDSKNIFVRERVPLKTMLEGSKIKVHTPWGVRSLAVPPTSFPGTTLFVPKAGVKKLGGMLVSLVEPEYPRKEEVKDGSWDALKFKWGIENEEDEDEEFLKQVTFTYEKLIGEKIHDTTE